MCQLDKYWSGFDVIYPSGGGNGGDTVTVGVDLRLLMLEHSLTFNCNHEHYGPLYGGREDSGYTGDQAVVVTERIDLEGMRTAALEEEWKEEEEEE